MHNLKAYLITNSNWYFGTLIRSLTVNDWFHFNDLKTNTYGIMNRTYLYIYEVCYGQHYCYVFCITILLLLPVLDCLLGRLIT